MPNLPTKRLVRKLLVAPVLFAAAVVYFGAGNSMADEFPDKRSEKKLLKATRKVDGEAKFKVPGLKQNKLKIKDPSKLVRKLDSRRERIEHHEIKERMSNRNDTKDVVNRARYAPVQPYRQQDGERLTVDLPSDYAELDSDFDGQIGFYEWIKTRRQDMELFERIDSNIDGFLTPRELKEFGTTSASSAADKASSLATKYSRPRLQVIGGTYHLTARGPAPTREDLPDGYNPGKGRSREESAKLHQNYVDQRMARLSAAQKQQIKRLWDEKQRNDPNMKNRGASFVQIMEHVANEK